MSKIPKYFYRLFKTVNTLEEYLEIRVEELDLPTDEIEALIQLSKKIIIVIPKDLNHIYNPNHFNETVDDLDGILSEVMQFILSQWSVKNVLSSGYYMTSGGWVSEKFTDTSLNKLKKDHAWSILLKCAGKDKFCELLLDTVILHSLPNGGYYQLSGPRLTSDNKLDKDEHVNKKRKTSTPRLEQYYETFLHDVNKHTSNLSQFLNSLLSTKKRKHVSQPTPNKKQTIERSNPRKPKTCIDRDGIYYIANVIDKESKDVVMKISSQHVLHSVKKQQEENCAQKCLQLMFPKELSSRSQKKSFYNRFQNTLETLVEQIQKRHNRVRFSDVLNRKCPKNDSIVQLTYAASTHSQVYQFIREIIRKTFPQTFWGSSQNYEQICESVKLFISRGKGEKLTIAEISHSFRTLDCKWLAPNLGTRVVPSDLNKRERMLRQFFKWFFNFYLTPIITSFFYVTLHAEHGKGTFFFRRDVWHTLTRPRIENLLKSGYYMKIADVVPDYECIDLSAGIGKIKLFPKRNGLRMITNMRHTIKYSENHSTRLVTKRTIDTNEVLHPVLDVLTFEKNKNPDLMGSSVLGSKLFYKKFKEFKQKMQPVSESKYYFVKVDISNCFDNIDQDKLQNILDDILTSDEYLFRVAHKLKPFMNKIVSKTCTAAGTATNMDNFEDFAEKMNDLADGSILVDQTTYLRKTVKEIKALLEECVSRNFVLEGNTFYKRIRGIAQGSCLSTILCSFFFGKLESEKLPFVKNDPDGALFTYIDDFLYITKKKINAVEFIRVMTQDLSDFGVSVNIDKCVSNLKTDIVEFPFLGYNINTKTLDVSIDTSSRRRKDVLASTSVGYDKRPLKHLASIGISTMKTKFLDILMDDDFNSVDTVKRNLYDNFSFVALKIEIQATELAKSATGLINEKGLLEIVLRLGQLALSMCPSKISKSDLLQIYFSAFYDVFVKRASRYPYLNLYFKYVLTRYRKSFIKA